MPASWKSRWWLPPTATGYRSLVLVAWTPVDGREGEGCKQATRFPNGFEDLVKVHGALVGLATFQPGWRWSNDVRPLMGTDSCPMCHVGYVLFVQAAGLGRQGAGVRASGSDRGTR
jgi:hypothetical protein